MLDILIRDKGGNAEISISNFEKRVS